MKKVDNVTFSPKMRLIHHTTTYPNGDKVDTYETKDLGVIIKKTTNNNGKKKVEVHTLTKDVYDRSQKMAKIFTMCDED